MVKYFITIIDLKTGTRQELLRNNTDVLSTLYKELGGYSNIIETALIPNNLINNGNYAEAGFTRDNTKAYSVLAITFPSEEVQSIVDKM